MQTHYAVLAQITTTLLAILAASVMAYSVFLQDRVALYDDNIHRDRIAIRESLLELRAGWPWTIGRLLQPEFADTYRGKHAEESKVGVISHAVTDLIFDGPTIKETIEQTRNDTFYRGQWKSRVYSWILSEAVGVIAGGTPDSQTRTQGVFPSSLSGPGFEQWRRDFTQLAGTVALLSHMREAMVLDFEEFVEGSRSRAHLMPLTQNMLGAYERFFDQVRSVRIKLADIDKQEAIKTRYSFSDRINRHSLVVLSLLALLLGILVPLALLVWKVETSAIVGTVLLVMALVPTFGALVQFGWDVWTPPKEDPHRYILERWYFPLLRDLERQDAKLQNGGLVDREMFINASNSSEASEMSTAVTEGLGEYLRTSSNYNEKSLAFSTQVISRMRTDPILEPLISGYRSGNQSATLYPADILNERRLQEIVKSLSERPGSDISVETLMPQWSRVEVRMPGGSFAAAPKRLRDVLDGINADVAGGQEARQFLEAREQLEETSGRLKAAIKSSIP